MKKRKIKPQFKKIIILCIVLVLVLVGIFNMKRVQLMMKGYGLKEQNLILDLDKNQIKSILGYDKEINLEKWNQVSNDGYYYLYDKLQAKTKQSTSDCVNYIDGYMAYESELDELGFSEASLLKYAKTFTINDYDYFIQNHLELEAIKPYLSIKNYITSDIQAYQETGSKPLEAVFTVSYPHIDSSQSSNREYEVVEADHILTLVKEGFILDKDYVPDDLRNVEVLGVNGTCQLREQAASGLEDMARAAKKKGYILMIKTAYQSYADQKETYDACFKTYDRAIAATLVDKPGYSEYQLGLSVDMTSEDVLEGTYASFSKSPDYKWMKKNAHKYGFILRYPKDKSELTGADNAPYCFRYVGKKAAKEMYDNKWTLEDYILENGFAYTVQKN